MLQIGDVLVSLDVLERYFHCDTSVCKGECCIEGDAGAPISEEEYEKLQGVIPEIYEDLLPGAKAVVEEQGPGYYDEEGDLVTSIVNGRDCVFTTYGKDGQCLCLLEKLWREGRLPENIKPSSCYLYPIRLKSCGVYTGVNYHRWKICKCAEVLGRAKGVRVYEFLKEPLIRQFGREWYEELALAAEEYFKQKAEGRL